MILDVHGGRIAVTSRENHGSTFEITLPRVVAPAAPALPSLAAQ
jgi:signal transduction histidine kinase